MHPRDYPTLLQLAENREAHLRARIEQLESELEIANRALVHINDQDPPPNTLIAGDIVLARGTVEDVCNGFASVRWDTKCQDECVDLVPVDALRNERWTAEEIADVERRASELDELFANPAGQETGRGPSADGADEEG